MRRLVPTPVALSRTHRQRIRRARDRVFTELDAATPEDPPVLVFTMGKVGSRSVHESIRRAELSRDPFHLHHIAAIDRERISRRLRKLGYLQEPYRHVGRAVREYLDRHPIEYPWKIITLVRDPVARQISSYFQPELARETVLDDFGRFKPEDALADLEAKLQRPTTFRYFDQWLDREIKGVFGVDLLNRPFDKEAGFGIFTSEKAEVLVITLEKLDAVFADAVPPFLGSERPFSLVKMNIRSTMLEAAAHEWVKKRIRLTPSAADHVYGLHTVTHFYDDATIERWKRHWTRPRTEPR